MSEKKKNKTVKCYEMRGNCNPIGEGDHICGVRKESISGGR